MPDPLISDNSLFIADKEYKRIDKFLADNSDRYSRSFIEKMIILGNVTVNEIVITRKNFRIYTGDKVRINYVIQKSYIPDKIKEFPSLKKLYEDDHILIIDKPSGISIHPGSGARGITILDIFISEFPEVKNIKGTDRPGIVHRLDKGTSGVLILAKTNIAMGNMQKKFKRREIYKEYYGLVHGKIRFINGSISTPIKRNPIDRRKFVTISTPFDNSDTNIRDAETTYSLLYQFKDSAFMKFIPKTGRTHQIRVHISSLGNPILGDDFYGKKYGFSRLALHAAFIRFKHPVYNFELSSYSGVPDSFKKYISRQFKSASVN